MRFITALYSARWREGFMASYKGQVKNPYGWYRLSNLAWSLGHAKGIEVRNFSISNNWR